MMTPLLKNLLAAVMLISSAHAAADDNKITLMVSSIEKQIYLPAKLAERLGYLKETGLEIELLSTATGSSAEKEMLSGVAQGVIGFYDHTIHLQARGKLVQSVVQFGLAPGEVMVVSQVAGKSVKSLADLRNKTLGVTGLGSSTHLLTQYLLAKAGVKSRDYSVLPVGAGARFISALNQGRIDAGMTTEPTLSYLKASGAASILVDMRTVSSSEAVLGGIYPGACLYMPSAWIGKNRDSVQKIVNAFVKTLRYIESHSAAEIAELMPAEYYDSDKKAYIEALEMGKRMFATDGLMPENGPPTVLRVLKDFDKVVQGKPINLDNTFTNEFAHAARY
jgi:NitT/TauT family transport system substrate-binding protein